MHRRTLARLTGLAYFGLLPGAIVGYLTIRPRLVDPELATNTLANVATHGDLAQLAVFGLMTVILAQALAALGFYALFYKRQPVAAFGIASFGLVNSAAILAGVAASWTAMLIAPTLTPEQAPLIQALYTIEGRAWDLGGLFFGLWLIPMGWAVWTSGEFHAGGVLGRVLVLGGLVYPIGTFLGLLPTAVDAGLVDLCALPATVGELWMIGALLVVGVKEPVSAQAA